MKFENRVFIIFVVLLALPVVAAEKNKTTFDSPWNGRYLHSSDKFELILNQFSEDTLDVNILPIPRTDHEHESHFFASIHQNLATLSDKREPGCRVDLKRVPAGVIILDHCNGAGDDAGFYRREKTKAGT